MSPSSGAICAKSFASEDASFRNILRMIFPERVFGKPLTIIVSKEQALRKSSKDQKTLRDGEFRDDFCHVLVREQFML